MATEVNGGIEAGRKVITGNYAVSYGAALSRAQVIAAYPITPQTAIVELLADFCAEGILDAKFIKVESEHSAMAACIGASAVGARAFTATSAQGLALMHELLHWAAGARLPVVLAEVNRAMASPWSIWTDQNDSLAQRDTGWLQYYCESNQETLDTVVQAFKVAERVHLPVMVVLDAFFLSHTSEAVEVPEQDLVDRYLPHYQPQFKLDIDDPRAFGGIAMPGEYMELRYKMQEAMEQSLRAAREADQRFQELFGRSYGLVEPYMLEDAEVALVTSATVSSTSRLAIKELREQGVPVGMLKIRLFRPFPIGEVREHLSAAAKVAVIDRNISFGYGGIFAQEIKSALYNYDLDSGPGPPLFGFVAGLGGRDITPELIKEIVQYAFDHDRPEGEIIWMGVKR